MEFNNNDNNERKPPNKDQLGLEVTLYWCGTGIVMVISDKVGRPKIKYRFENDRSGGEKAQ